jgi:hypothetical protein
MKNPVYLQYRCSRCGDEIKDTDEVMVIKFVLGGKEKTADLAGKCIIAFEQFMKEGKDEHITV